MPGRQGGSAAQLDLKNQAETLVYQREAARRARRTRLSAEDKGKVEATPPSFEEAIAQEDYPSDQTVLEQLPARPLYCRRACVQRRCRADGSRQPTDGRHGSSCAGAGRG